MKLGLTALVLATLGQGCRAERLRGRRINVAAVAGWSGDDLHSDTFAVPERRTLDTQGVNATDISFEPSPTQSPDDWLLATTENTYVRRGDGGGFGGRLPANGRSRKNANETTVFDPFVEEEAGKQVKNYRLLQ